MARRIKYPTTCAYCGTYTAAGKGWLQRTNGMWLCQCDACYHSRELRKEHASQREEQLYKECLEDAIGSLGQDYNF